MNGAVEVVGVDSAEGMVRAAQAKIEHERLPRVSFHCMPAERLTLADETFDRALCRFGVMLFGDPSWDSGRCAASSSPAADSPSPSGARRKR